MRLKESQEGGGDEEGVGREGENLDGGVALSLGAGAADQVGDEYDDDQTGQASSDDDRNDVRRSNVVVAQFRS